MNKKYEDMTDLERINYFNSRCNKAWSRFEDDLIEFSFNHDYEDDGYWIEADNKLILQGIISMKTHKPLNKWFDEYHNLFIQMFDLKLIRVYRTESIGGSKSSYNVDYTTRIILVSMK